LLEEGADAYHAGDDAGAVAGVLTSSWELMYRFGWLNSYAAIIVPGR